jgi:hypothetical protein
MDASRGEALMDWLKVSLMRRRKKTEKKGRRRRPPSLLELAPRSHPLISPTSSSCVTLRSPARPLKRWPSRKSSGRGGPWT